MGKHLRGHRHARQGAPPSVRRSSLTRALPTSRRIHRLSMWSGRVTCPFFPPVSRRAAPPPVTRDSAKLTLPTSRERRCKISYVDIFAPIFADPDGDDPAQAAEPVRRDAACARSIGQVQEDDVARLQRRVRAQKESGRAECLPTQPLSFVTPRDYPAAQLLTDLIPRWAGPVSVRGQARPPHANPA